MKLRVIPVTHYEQNCSLIGCEESGMGALIDPGGEAPRLLQAAEEEEVEIEKILLTHGHLDHVGAARQIARQLDIPILGPHRADAFWLQMLPSQAQMFSFPDLEAFEPDRWLEEGDRIKVGETTLEVLHCPGHTPGHVVFYSAAERLAFVGDVLFQGSVGRSDFPQGDHAALIASIKNKLLPLGDEVTFVPGHGPSSTFGFERRNNPYL